MFCLSSTRVHLAMGCTDMRKSINGLSLFVEKRLKMDPFCGHLFAFCNRRQNMIKILYWDRNGFCLWCKRLEKGRFRWPDTAGEASRIEMRQLLWLLDGLELNQARAHKRLNYSILF
jgi:transposase